MKMLVTGGAGFIGSNLVDQLLKDRHSVTVLDDFNDFYTPDIKWNNLSESLAGITLHQADFRDAEKVMEIFRAGQFDVVYHLGARAGVRPSILQPRLYIETNVLGTANLLEAARQTGVSRFVNASSSSVYGVIPEVPFHENLCLNRTISPYAATKLAAEQLCSNYSHLYGIRVISLRFFTVYGPRQRPDLAIARFTRSILKGETIDQFGDGSTRRDYTYIDDIIQGLTACLTYEGELCDVFNLGENQTTTLSGLISLIEDALGKKAVIRQLPEQPGDVPLTYADISKARRLLGYNPVTKISEGIPKYVKWYLGLAEKN